ncbi:MAG: nicotinate-nucleotide adenylyltransferase [Syntrophomonadaceae bacterium]|nr:nicotinate-nucleotide adenylyltransferase [Syntrophomonadaceae bacterium]MDD3889759.1 nicotinate-nucleotide adenylyltransferase [Syntrophomonadaceae bacterium]
MERTDKSSFGILGGTFDPIHYGHLIAAEYARCEFNLTRVIFMPAARPPHKQLEYVLAEEHRYKMVELAIKNNPAFEVSSLEMDREGYSYTVDTIEYFLKNCPEQEIYFIMGADSLLFMDTWKEYERLATLCKFVVVTRPGYILDKRDKRLQHLPSGLWNNIRGLQIPGLDISSSDIRKRAAEGRPIKYLLPPGVEEYIDYHYLYREEGTGYDK